MQKPKVTIAIPAFKPTFLKNTIDSVLAQSFQDFEIVIVNDKSPYPITEVVNTYKDDRIRYFINECNLGAKDPAANWNQCLKYAQGEYFALLCDDDLYAPTFLEEMLSLADRYPKVSVFRSGAKTIDKNGDLVEYSPASPEWESVEDYMYHVYHKLRNQTISEFLHRTNNLRENGGYVNLPLAWGADYISIYQLAQNGGIASSFKRLVSFRMSGENITSINVKYTKTKILAGNLADDMARKIITDNNYSIKEILFKLMVSKRNSDLRWQLSVATIPDFISIALHKNLYKVSIRNLLESLIYRVIHK